MPLALIAMMVALPGAFPGAVALHLAAAGVGTGFMLFHICVQHAVGEAVGVRTVVLNASHTVLPLAFGGVGAALGMVPVFWTMSTALASGAWLANRRRLVERAA